MIIVLIAIIFIFNLILLDKRVKAVTGKWPEFHFLINLIFSILMLTAIELELATYVLKITDNISINLHPQGIFFVFNIVADFKQSCEKSEGLWFGGAGLDTNRVGRVCSGLCDYYEFKHYAWSD